MAELRFFMDTHDVGSKTFPENLTAEGFSGFYPQYLKACQEEGVIPVRLHVGLGQGRAFCFNLAPDTEAVRRAHERVGLPFDSITEVNMVTPGDMFLQRAG